MNDWLRAKQRARLERERRAIAQRVKLWPIESNAPHQLGCACWDCVLELLREVALSQQLYAPWQRRRPLVPR